MTGITRTGVVAVVVPATALSAALGRVDPTLLVGAALALAGTFGIVYAYARYVGPTLDDASQGEHGTGFESSPASRERRGE